MLRVTSNKIRTDLNAEILLPTTESKELQKTVSHEHVSRDMAVCSPEDILLFELIDSGKIDGDWNFFDNELVSLICDDNNKKKLFEVSIWLNGHELKYSFFEFLHICSNAALRIGEVEQFLLHGSYVLELLGLQKIKEKLQEKFPQHHELIERIYPFVPKSSDIDLRLNAAPTISGRSFTEFLNKEILYDLLENEIVCVSYVAVDSEINIVEYSISQFCELLPSLAGLQHIRVKSKNHRFLINSKEGKNLFDFLEANNYSLLAFKTYIFQKHINHIPEFLRLERKVGDGLDIEYNELKTNTVPVDFTYRRKAPAETVRITQQNLRADLLPTIQQDKEIVVSGTLQDVLDTYLQIGRWVKFNNNNIYDWCAYIYMLTSRKRFPNDQAEQMLTATFLNENTEYFLLMQTLWDFKKVKHLSSDYKAIYILNACEILRPNLQNQKKLICQLSHLSPLCRTLINPMSRYELSYNTVAAVMQFISFEAIHLPLGSYSSLPFVVDIIQHKGNPHVRFTYRGATWFTSFNLEEAWKEIIKAAEGENCEVLEAIFSFFCGTNNLEFAHRPPFTVNGKKSVYPGLHLEGIIEYLASPIPFLRRIAIHQFFSYILSNPEMKSLDHLFILLSHLKQNTFSDFCSEKLLKALFMNYLELFHEDTRLFYIQCIENYLKQKKWNALGRGLLFMPHEKMMQLGIDAISDDLQNAFAAIDHQISKRKIKNSILILEKMANLKIGEEQDWNKFLNKLLKILINTKSTVDTFHIKINAAKRLQPLLFFALDRFSPDLSFFENWNQVISLFTEIELMESADKIAEYRKNRETLTRKEFLQSKIEKFIQNPTFDKACNLLNENEEFSDFLASTFIAFFHRSNERTTELHLRLLFEPKIQRLLSKEFENTVQQVLKPIKVVTQKTLNQLLNILLRAPSTSCNKFIKVKTVECLIPLIFEALHNSEPNPLFFESWDGIIELFQKVHFNEAAAQLLEFKLKWTLQIQENLIKQKISLFFQKPTYNVACELLNCNEKFSSLLILEFVRFFEIRDKNFLEVKLRLLLDSKFQQLLNENEFEKIFRITVEGIAEDQFDNAEQTKKVINQSMNVLISIHSSSSIQKRILDHLSSPLFEVLHRYGPNLNFIENWSEVVNLFHEAGLTDVAEKILKIQTNWLQIAKENFLREKIAVFLEKPTLEAAENLFIQHEEFSNLLSEMFIEILNSEKIPSELILSLVANERIKKILTENGFGEHPVLKIATLKILLKEPSSDLEIIENFAEDILFHMTEKANIPRFLFVTTYRALMNRLKCQKEPGKLFHIVLLWKEKIQKLHLNQHAETIFKSTHQELSRIMSGFNLGPVNEYDVMVAAVKANIWSGDDYKEFEDALLKKFKGTYDPGMMRIVAALMKFAGKDNYYLQTLDALYLGSEDIDFRKAFFACFMEHITTSDNKTITVSKSVVLHVQYLMQNKNVPSDELNFIGVILSRHTQLKFLSSKIYEEIFIEYFQLCFNSLDQNRNFIDCCRLIRSEFGEVFTKLITQSLDSKDKPSSQGKRSNNAEILNQLIKDLGEGSCFDTKFLLYQLPKGIYSLLLSKNIHEFDFNWNENHDWITKFHKEHLVSFPSQVIIPIRPNELTDTQCVLIVKALLRISRGSDELLLLRTCLINKFCTELANSGKIEVIELIREFLFMKNDHLENSFFYLFMENSKHFNYELVTQTPGLASAVKIPKKLNGHFNYTHHIIFGEKLDVQKNNQNVVSVYMEIFNLISNNRDNLSPPNWLISKLCLKCRNDPALKTNRLLVIRSMLMSFWILTSKGLKPPTIHEKFTLLFEEVKKLLLKKQITNQDEILALIKEIDLINKAIVSDIKDSPISFQLQGSFLTFLSKVIEVLFPAVKQNIDLKRFKNMFEINEEIFFTLFNTHRDRFLNETALFDHRIEFCSAFIQFDNEFSSIDRLLLKAKVKINPEYWWKFCEITFDLTSSIKDVQQKKKLWLASLIGLKYWYSSQKNLTDADSQNVDFIKLNGFKIKIIGNLEYLFIINNDISEALIDIFCVYPEIILKFHDNWNYFSIFKAFIKKLESINDAKSKAVINDINIRFMFDNNYIRMSLNKIYADPIVENQDGVGSNYSGNFE